MQETNTKLYLVIEKFFELYLWLDFLLLLHTENWAQKCKVNCMKPLLDTPSSREERREGPQNIENISDASDRCNYSYPGNYDRSPTSYKLQVQVQK